MSGSLNSGRDDVGVVRVEAVVAAKNEAHNIGWVLEALLNHVDSVLVVDGHSQDDTVRIASEYPNVTVMLQSGKGKGTALLEGMAASDADIIVLIDADGSTSPEEVPLFVSAILGGAEYVKGSRGLPEGGSADLTFMRSLGNAFLRTCVNVFFGTSFTDLCYGFNAVSRSSIAEMGVHDLLAKRDLGDDFLGSGFEIETLLNIRAVRAGLKISEVPSFELNRSSGESNLHVVRDGTRVLRTILSERFSPRSRFGASVKSADIVVLKDLEDRSAFSESTYFEVASQLGDRSEIAG